MAPDCGSLKSWALKVSDIDSERMLLHIEQGKGRKDRFAMLSPRLLELLRDWYRIARPRSWLFPGRDPLAAADDAAIQSRRFMPLPRGGDQEASYASHIAPQLCHPPARRENRCAFDPSLARTMPGSIRPRSTRR